METSFFSLHLVGVRFLYLSKVHTVIEKYYPHKMLLNMPFAYNYILCYLEWAVVQRLYVF